MRSASSSKMVENWEFFSSSNSQLMIKSTFSTFRFNYKYFSTKCKFKNSLFPSAYPYNNSLQKYSRYWKVTFSNSSSAFFFFTWNSSIKFIDFCIFNLLFRNSSPFVTNAFQFFNSSNSSESIITSNSNCFIEQLFFKRGEIF